MKSSPVVALNGLLQRAGLTPVENNRITLSAPTPLVITGDFTMNRSVHVLSSGTGSRVDVRNIYGAEIGEVLFLYGDDVRLRPGGNILIPRNFDLRNGATILLYYADPWVPMSVTTWQ